MSFLIDKPIVCVINDEYEILLHAKEKGIFAVEIGGKRFYAENAGTLSSEKNFCKIRMKQCFLDNVKKYAVLFRESIDRKAYFSEMGEERREEYMFKPLEKKRDIHAYHIADVHYAFSTAKKTAAYFGKDIDLWIFNGDIGEVETEAHYLDTIAFVAELSQGKIPVLFVRGNHDTRGKLAEKFVEYYPANGYNTFYTFSLGCLQGVVLDCGEDKVDNHQCEGYENPDVYAGVNDFRSYRERETEFLKGIELPEGKITFAVSHICPVMTTWHKGDIFDIERDTYAVWNQELERLGISFMLCGHLHKIFILQPDDDRNTLSHNYPVVVGSQIEGVSRTESGEWTAMHFYGAALTINPESIEVAFTDECLTILGRNKVFFNKR